MEQELFSKLSRRRQRRIQGKREEPTRRDCVRQVVKCVAAEGTEDDRYESSGEGRQQRRKYRSISTLERLIEFGSRKGTTSIRKYGLCFMWQCVSIRFRSI